MLRLLLIFLPALVLAELRPQSRSFKMNTEIAEPHSWPWQVSLQYKSNFGGIRFRHECSGILIHRSWVMTSARCVQSVLVSGQWRAVLGGHDLGAMTGTEQIMGGSLIRIHPEWSSSYVFKGNDVALMKLSSEATENAYVQVLPLPPAGRLLPHDTPCYFAGWGQEYVTHDLVAPLQQAFAPLVDYQTCSSRDWWGTIVSTNMLCAGRSELTCSAGIYESRGFWGGALSCQVEGKYYAEGIFSVASTSFCATSEKPPLFTRVSGYIDWINSVIS